MAARLCALRGFFQSYGWWGRGALRCRLKRREFSERADDAAAGWGTAVGPVNQVTEGYSGVCDNDSYCPLEQKLTGDRGWLDSRSNATVSAVDAGFSGAER